MRRSHLKQLVVLIPLGLLMLYLLTACSQSFLKSPHEESVSSTDKSQLDLPAADEDLELLLETLELDQPEDIYNKVHPDAIRRFGREQIVERHKKIHENLGISAVRYQNVECLKLLPEEARRIYMAEIEMDCQLGTISKEQSFSLIYNHKSGRWELDWQPGIIVPGLHERGTVRVRDLVAKRGEIFDREGRSLAANVVQYQIGIVPADLNLGELPAIAELLKTEVEILQEKIQATWVTEDSFVPLVTWPEVDAETYQKLRDFRLRVEPTSGRSYPYGEDLAILLGYIGPVSVEDLARPENKDLSPQQEIGKTGIEQIFDRRLRGQNGFQLYVTGEEELILLESPLIPGEDLHLTIDAELQKSLMVELRGEDDVFAGIVLNPEDGTVMATISTPSYDPTLFINGIATRDYETLVTDPRLPLYNKFNALYTPGSTQKVLSALAFLTDPHFQPEEGREIRGESWQKDASWGDYKVRRVAQIETPLDLEEALIYSDNIYFAQVAIELGAASYLEGLESLAFGQPFRTAYPFLNSSIAQAAELDADVLLGDTAYGQGQVLVNPVELCAIYSAILTGQVPEPKMLLEEDFPARAKLALSASERQLLQRALRGVVTERYAQAMERKGLKIAGKSGTAEIGLDSEGKMQYNSWFVGYDQAQPEAVLALCLLSAQDHEATYCHEHFADCLEIISRHLARKNTR